MNDVTIAFRAHGMHCHGCEHVIEARVRKLGGVRLVSACYPTETVVVDYDPGVTRPGAIRAAVEALGYRVEDGEPATKSLLQRLARLAGALIGLAALILIDTRWISAGGAPDVSRHMSLWLIFVLGLVTGFHCIGMCGGFVVSYTAANAEDGGAPALAHLSFALGKTLSYTAMGALFGALGAVVAFTPLLRGAAGVGAGFFLVIFGLNMLGLFAPLRRFRLGLPAPLQRFVDREAVGGRHRPFVIGLLNGLMIACGPLQAMYVMAAGSGSASEGAQMLLAFGLGTLPVMLAFGAVASLLSSALTHRLLRASGVILLALGAVMINRGLILTGSGADLASLVAQLRRAPAVPAPPAASVQTIEMEANALGYHPSHFTLTKGVPVKWTINATEITSCNNRILVPALGLEIELKPGPQTVEFTPTRGGVIPWSCWMGMMRGEFEVIEPGAAPAPAGASPEQAVHSLSCSETPAGAQAPQPERCSSEAAKPASADTPAPYIVRRGETLEAIARKLYGDPGRWRDIAAANPGLRKGRLKAGQALALPRRP